MPREPNADRARDRDILAAAIDRAEVLDRNTRERTGLDPGTTVTITLATARRLLVTLDTDTGGE